MRPQTFQHPEIRDENDNIIKPGAFGKNTPFCTKGNDGILDYIANDLEYLYENRGSGGGGQGIQGPRGDPGPAADLSQYVKKTEIFDGNMIKLPNGAKIGVE